MTNSSTHAIMDLSKTFSTDSNMETLMNLLSYRQWSSNRELYQLFNCLGNFHRPLQQMEALDLSMKKSESTNEDDSSTIWTDDQLIFIKREKEQRKENSSSINCAMCSSTFLTMGQLNRHFDSKHKEFVITYSYNIQHNRSKQTFQSHLASLRCLNPTDSSDKLQCPSCHYRAKWPTELEKHVMVHSFGRPFSCYICSKSYKWIWDLGRHFHKNHIQFDNPYRKTSRSKTKLV